jgi:trk system potassium uptake protein
LEQKKTGFEFNKPAESELVTGFWAKLWVFFKNFVGGTPARIILTFFITLISVGTLLLLLPISTVSGASPSVLVALFTSTSAVCVTGLVLVDTGSYWSTFGHIVILLLIQFGAIGFASSSIFILFTHRRASFEERRLLQIAVGKGRQGVLKLALFIIAVTLVCELIGAFLLFLGWVGEMGVAKAAWWGVFHSVAAFANAGFDIAGTVEKPFPSLIAYSSNFVICLVIPLLIILGGIGFNVIYEILKYPKQKRLSLHAKVSLWALLALTLIGTALIWMREAGNPKTLGSMNFAEQGVNAFFHSVSPRTAGFNTIDLTVLDSSTIFILMIWMFIGGGSGSTAGGVKASTIVVVLATLRSSVLGLPNVLFKKTIPQRIVSLALAVGAIYSGSIIMFTLLISLFEDFGLTQIFFEVISAFCTVGLSLGITPQLSLPSQLLLIAAMFIGRLGVIITILALSGERQTKTLVTYPEEEVMVG